MVEGKNSRRSPDVAQYEASLAGTSSLWDDCHHEVSHLRSKRVSCMLCAALAWVMLESATSFLNNCCPMSEDSEA